jgi:glycosyltransferase involved in cell wall biosynthesis
MISVAVVIPSYNQADFLEAAIKSVLNQSVHTQIIVVDGRSTDNSVAVIKKYES